MYKRTLVPLDGSKLAEVVLPYAKELAGRLDLDVILLHVCGSEESGLATMSQAYVEHAAEIIRRESAEVQRRTGAPAGCKPVEAKGALAVGDPAEEILNYAEKNDIDLIIMATHGRSGVRRWIIGSVADKVLRASKVPVWLVRAVVTQEIVYDQWPRITVLVPLDGSELAVSVLPHAEALAKQRGTERVDVVLLRVCEPPVIPSDYPPSRPLSWEEHVEQRIAESKRTCEIYLDEVERQIKARGLNVRSEVLLGNPAEEIVNYANSNPFSLIVMSTYGRSGISRWAYGSVADKVLQGVSCPILLIRPS